MKRTTLLLILLIPPFLVHSQDLIPQTLYLENPSEELQHVGQFLFESLCIELSLLAGADREESHKQLSLTAPMEDTLIISLKEQGETVHEISTSAIESPGDLLLLAQRIVVEFAVYLEPVEPRETLVFYQEDQQLQTLQELLNYRYASLGRRNEIHLTIGGSLTAMNMAHGGISADYSLFPFQFLYTRFKTGANRGAAFHISYSQGRLEKTVPFYRDISASAGWAGRLAEERFSAYYSSTFGISLLQFDDGDNSSHLLWELHSGLCIDIKENWMLGTGLGFHLAFPVGFDGGQSSFDRTIYSLVGGLVLGFRF